MRSRADVAQSVEHSLGKGEVIGSIPIISSRVLALLFGPVWRVCFEDPDAGLVVCFSGTGGSNSVVESQPSKLLVAGPIPVSRSRF
jgi:hypothetical protein